MNDQDDKDITELLDRTAPRALSDGARQRTLEQINGSAEKRVNDQRDDDRDSAPSFPIWRVLAPLAAAACLALVLLLPRALDNDNDNAVQPNPRWTVVPASDARYTWTTSNQIDLTRGEIRVQASASSVSDSPELIVVTPAGQVRATSPDFFVGTHLALNTDPKGNAEMKRYFTRSLVLAGTVTLTNAMGTLTGGANEVLAMEAEQAPVAVTVRANSDFAIDLYRELAKANESDNLFFSPYSVSTTLTMVLDGARGDTAEQIGGVLRLPDAAKRVGPDAQQIPWRASLLHTGLADLNKTLMGDRGEEEKELREKLVKLEAELEEVQKQVRAGNRDLIVQEMNLVNQVNSLRKQINGVTLNVASAIWGEQTYDFNPDYTKRINAYYKTGGIFPADFRNNARAERARINQWVAEQTNGKITEIIGEGSITDQTRMILLNAIHFQGQWADPFNTELTKDVDFQLADGGKVSATTMHAYKSESVWYGAFNADGSDFESFTRFNDFSNPGEGGFHVLSIPYRGGDTSMMVIAPQDPGNLAGVETLLSTDAINAWSDQLEGDIKVNIALPKFKMETDSDLKPLLKNLGMTDAFIDGKADLTDISASPSDHDRLYIEKVVQKAYVDVNEKGTEAAATTGVWAHVGIDKVADFRADRPFLFLIRDNRTGTILFMGRVTDPSSLK